MFQGTWKSFAIWEISGVLIGKQGLSLKQPGKIYHCCVTPVLLYCYETWELTVMYGVKLVDRVSTFVPQDRVCVAVKIEDMIIQNRLRQYGHVIREDINCQIREVMELERTAKRKKGRPSKSWEKCLKKDIEQYGLRKKKKKKMFNPGQLG